jgi:iron complex outermembrane receptor protein
MKNYFLLLLLLISGFAKSQFNLGGRVISGADKLPLPGCMVLAHTKGIVPQVTHTDSLGDFNFKSLPAGDYTFIISANSYKTFVDVFTLNADIKNKVFELEPLQVVSDEVVIEGIRSKSMLASTYTVLDFRAISKKNYGQDLPVILNTTPSLVYTTDAGAGVGYTGLRIRGVDATRINVTINGVPLNDAESHGVYWVDLPDLAANIQSLQVQRGVGTSTNGSAAFGSSINIETKHLYSKPYFNYTAGYGSFNTFRNNLKFGTGLLEHGWVMEGSLSKISSDGYIQRASSNLQSGYLSVGHYGTKSLLKFNILHGNERTYQSWYGVPQDSLKTNRNMNFYTYPGQTDNYTQTHYQLLYSYALRNDLMLNATLFYVKGKGYYENYNAGAVLADYGMPDFKRNDSSFITSSDIIDRKWLDNDFYGTILSAIYKKKKYEIDGGASYSIYNGLHFNEVIWSELWTAPKPNGSFSPFRYYEDKGVKKDGSVYGKLFYYFTTKLTGFADMQVRSLSYNYNAPDTGYVLHNLTQNYFFMNPKLGIIYKLHEKNELLLYYGRSAHEPTRDEFVQSTAASLPRAEYLNDIELAWSVTLSGWNFKVNLYDMMYKDQLVLTGKINDVGAPVRQNVKSSYRRGVEFMIEKKYGRFEWNGNVTLSQNRINNFSEYLYNYAYDSSFVFHYASVPIAFSPSVIASSSLQYMLKYFTFELVSKYIGSQYMDNSGSQDRMLDPYFLNDLHIRYAFGKMKHITALSISAVIYNILDVKYSSNGYTYGDYTSGVRTSYNYYYPQAGRNYMLMLNLAF